MGMGVRSRDGFRVFMLMMLVVDVFVRMLQRFMGMRMFMVLGQVQPNACAH